MPYRELEPHPALRPFVDRFWVRAGTGQSEAVRVLPDGCIDLILDRSNGGGGRVVVGAMTRALFLELPPAHRLVAVRFRPAGAIPFLGVAAAELTDRRVEVGDLGLRWLTPPDADRPLDLLRAARLLERCLLDRLAAVPPPDPRVARAVRALFLLAPPPVDRLAQQLGFTRQHLARVFRAQVGLGPKALARIARVHRAVGCLQSGNISNLADAAVRMGYYDEAHMDRDFRQLVGVTPRLARASTGSIRPMLSLFHEA